MVFLMGWGCSRVGDCLLDVACFFVSGILGWSYAHLLPVPHSLCVPSQNIT
jgi:hypothetical protein